MRARHVELDRTRSYGLGKGKRDVLGLGREEDECLLSGLVGIFGKTSWEVTDDPDEVGACTEKLASGLIKPFVAHLKVAEEQVASAAESVKLDVGRRKNADAWFTKGTLERFVRFVSTPEVLELVNTFDAEMSQLEAARKIYSQELLRAIDLRLTAVQQDLSNACAGAAAAGFNVDTVSELQMFADSFGAHRLNKACGKFISLCERRPNLINRWKSGPEDRTVRSSFGSDMSIEDDPPSPPPRQEPATCQQPNPPPITFRTFSRESIVERDDGHKPNEAAGEKDRKDETSTPGQTGSIQSSQPGRRLSVQDRINMFENKQKENSGEKPVVVKPVELRRLSSDVPSMGAAAEKAVLRRWSGVSDMSIDLSSEKKDPSSSTVLQENKVLNLNDDKAKSTSIIKPEIKVIPSLDSNLVPGESDGLKDQVLGKTQSRSFISRADNQENSDEKFKILFGDKREQHVDIPSQRDDSESIDESIMQPRLKSGVFESVSGSRNREAFASRSVGETAVVEKEESHTSEKVSIGSVSGVEDSGHRRMKFSRIRTEAQEGFDSFTTPHTEQVQRVRQSKGNQERNDELKMKANELEKLFAEHQLRVPGDQSNSARKDQSEDAQREPANKPIGSSKNKNKLNAASLMKTVDGENYGDALNKKFSELSVSEGSRGKFYDRYTQKRDAKLKEDWSSNRAEKEARLKSMQVSLERSRSEMKAKFSGSAERQDPLSSARRRAERLRSYNSRSIMNRQQQYLDFGDGYDDEALDRASDEISFGDGISRGAQGKKLLPNNRNLSSSSTPRTSVAPVPRSATKTSTNSVKRRMQPENPLAQSVPNFSDLRKENTKPSSGGSKTTRSQVRNYARSKSITEETPIVKEDKSRRSQALRKSSANQSEFSEKSPLDSDGVVLTPIKFDDEVLKSVGTKAFLKKGSRAARTGIARQKSSVGSEPVNNVDDNDDVASELESTVKDEGEEELETLHTEELKISEDVETKLMLDSDKFNGDGTLTFSRVDQALGSQLTSDIPSNFLPVDSMQEWPGESPVSWNSRTQHPFSYPHEISDVDASVDSPVGSPSWNSLSFSQMEADAARMRKKWGTAQKPVLVSHSSNNLPRKDMTRGFKRFLKFGRKNRGSDLVDWISATTSEGDDDTDDGRDPASRYSEDFKKSRMGFSQAQPSDDSFNESEFFHESGYL
ncbi:hypothetical protein DH2020_041551 [Rehmannia glutinosa]|uniref:COP1-interacting protein 7 n=1 Tax=Rehmannia glutinosa TaxID=99300 RepID=A0ABR0UQY8_REHGL